MKVLNWVARRLLNVQSCTCVLPEDDMEKSDYYVNSKFDVEETHPLLKNNGGQMVMMDVLEDWKHAGFLTIGTLAIGPLDTTTTNFEIVEEEEEDDHNTNNTTDGNDINDYSLEHESNPLMNVRLFSHEVVDEKQVVVEEVACKEIVVEDNVGEIIEEDSTKSENRVTLADLLSADSGHKLVRKLGDQKLHQADVLSKDLNLDVTDHIEKPCMKTMVKPAITSGAKTGMSKAKKLLKEDLHPIKKLNQLMKRMTKKKIHPDMGGKMQEMQPNKDAANSTDGQGQGGDNI